MPLLENITDHMNKIDLEHKVSPYASKIELTVVTPRDSNQNITSWKVIVTNRKDGYRIFGEILRPYNMKKKFVRLFDWESAYGFSVDIEDTLCFQYALDQCIKMVNHIWNMIPDWDKVPPGQKL